jgi:hypothetical protein
MKAVKTFIFALTVSSILAFNGLAQPGAYWHYQKEKKEEKKKEPERPVEKKKNEDRGGDKKDDKKKEKKPDGESYKR